MNCVKCGRPIESSGHSCGYPPYTTSSGSVTDEAIWKLTQKMRLYEDMVEGLGWIYQATNNDYIEKLVQSLLDRAEKLK